MSDLCIFGLEVEINIAIFEINTLDFVKNDFLIHTVNFGVGPYRSEVHFF